MEIEGGGWGWRVGGEGDDGLRHLMHEGGQQLLRGRNRDPTRLAIFARDVLLRDLDVLEPPDLGHELQKLRALEAAVGEEEVVGCKGGLQGVHVLDDATM